MTGGGCLILVRRVGGPAGQSATHLQGRRLQASLPPPHATRMLDGDPPADLARLALQQSAPPPSTSDKTLGTCHEMLLNADDVPWSAEAGIRRSYGGGVIGHCENHRVILIRDASPTKLT